MGWWERGVRAPGGDPPIARVGSARRERAAREGQLLQADGSPHRWLGPDGPEWTLIAGIDDATGTIPWAVFRQHEDAAGYMTWLQHVVETEGVPVALYVDRHGIFQRRKQTPWTLEEELAGGPLPTQMGRVLEELGIRVIHALSPQAKGRVERLFGTLQDRLCVELRLAGLHAESSFDEANQVLWAYLPRFNARFAVAAASPETAYRPVADVLPVGTMLDQLCCFKYERVVALDNTVRFGEHRLQLSPAPGAPGARAASATTGVRGGASSPARPVRRSYVKARVAVHERLDGSLAVFHQGRLLTTTPAPPEAPILRARQFPRPARALRLTPTDAASAATLESSAPPTAPTVWQVGDPQPLTHPWRRPPVVDPDALTVPRRARPWQR